MRRVSSLLPVAFAFIVLSGACRNLDVVTASYGSLAEAEGAGAIAQGWMPSGLPPGTHDIREAHGAESRRRWGLFSFRAGEEPVLKRILEGDEMSLDGQ